MTARRPSWPYSVLLGLWAGAVWYLSDQSDPTELAPFVVGTPDWALHFAEFAVGGFLARGALRPVLAGRALVVPFGLCVLWALMDEWHQSFVPGRDPSGMDLALDAMGAAVGALAHAAAEPGGHAPGIEAVPDDKDL